MKTTLFRPYLAAVLFVAPLLLAGCGNDDEPEPDDENELITTVRYTLTPTTGGGQAVTVEWKDLDGAGGNAPTIGTLRLAPNTTYTGALSFLDESKNPAGNITAEVQAENDEHLVVYTPAPANLLTVTRTDRDKNNLEVGLATRVQTTTAATGTLKVVLRHQPDNKNGQPDLGSTDADVTFPVTVQ
ncbi:hypothetical protein D3Y59_14785 [Hymenobacter oligotrophus]|uniref:Type 1 periplasmic binding fold superfamily protein n=1 Tax=Hymenobacter oligotrophus TaxID=2319843 RepID=A0A3B7RG09_9BACT|nr:hypothetical protein [Hymenobacter oligotrophus]AYA38196.1 hypothetical protein D3Y59_14785 [Hymenobacter oligotrophus]